MPSALFAPASHGSEAELGCGSAAAKRWWQRRRDDFDDGEVARPREVDNDGRQPKDWTRRS